MTTRRRAKIVATLGPASSAPDVVRDLVEAGLDVARINFSHGDPESWRRAVESVRRAHHDTGKPIAILGDLQGPKIRIGELASAVEIARGDRLDIVSGAEHQGRLAEYGSLEVSCAYAALTDEVEPGGRIYLRDGELDLRVESIDGPRIITSVRGGGLLTSRAGLHAPGGGALLDAVTAADRDSARFAVEHAFDVLALSFVRDRDDIDIARDAVAEAGGDLPIIAKIETVSAINALESIIDAADGAMVARGDLGVELGAAEVPLAQREIITAAGRGLMPVIIATQMLESMTTRAPPNSRRSLRRRQRRLGRRRRADALRRNGGRIAPRRRRGDDGPHHPHRRAGRPPPRRALRRTQQRHRPHNQPRPSPPPSSNIRRSKQ